MPVRPRAALLVLSILAAPALAGNTLVPPGQRVAVAKSSLSVLPTQEWNRLGARPGRLSEEWTIDGDPLNDLTFYGGIADGRPLFREVAKKTKPLPRFAATMLLTDLPALLEQSYRIALDTPLMTVDAVEPATLAGRKAVRFRYTFTKPDEDVTRSGEALATIADGRLYMVSFEAPALYYFDRDVAAYRSVAASAQLGG